MRVDLIDWIYLVVAAAVFADLGCRSLYRSKSVSRWDLLVMIVALVFLVKFLLKL
jgi:hypothetical protein